MKKIALILLIKCFCYLNCAAAQDTSKQDTVRPKPEWRVTRLYFSVLPGFDIQDRHHGSIALAAPFGANFRFYNKNNMGDTFFDLDASLVPMGFGQDTYTSFFKLSVGLGFTGKTSNNQMHVGYLQSTGGYHNLIELGYDMETFTIPLTIDILTPSLTSKSYFFLIGIKVPVAKL